MNLISKKKIDAKINKRINNKNKFKAFLESKQIFHL
jgi:hypothetical protein